MPKLLNAKKFPSDEVRQAEQIGKRLTCGNCKHKFELLAEDVVNIKFNKPYQITSTAGITVYNASNAMNCPYCDKIITWEFGPVSMPWRIAMVSLIGLVLTCIGWWLF